MGCVGSRPAAGVLPSAEKNDGLLSAVPNGSSSSSGSTVSQPSDPSLSTVNGVGPANTRLNQGTHWAEASPGKERREAHRPWEPQNLGATPAPIAEGTEEVAPQAHPQDADKKVAFEFNCTFPMMVMKMSRFMKLDVMLPYEDLIESGDVFEWTPEMGKVFFLSHQWTSFSHPDPKSEQLTVAQEFLSKVAAGKIKSLFATEEEWLAFHYKESNRFLQFDPVTEESIAADARDGYVWLDYASVPQAV